MVLKDAQGGKSLVIKTAPKACVCGGGELGMDVGTCRLLSRLTVGVWGRGGVGVAVWKCDDVAVWGCLGCWVRDVCAESCGALG